MQSPITQVWDGEVHPLPISNDHGLVRMQVFMATQRSKANIRPESTAAMEDVDFLIFPLAALNAVLNRTPVDLKRFGGQVALYPGLAKQVLDQCKSALPDVSLSSMDEALLHLGVERVRVVLTTVLLREYCRSHVAPAAGHRFLQIAEATAQASESLARMTGYARPARAYLAGLMHDAGKLVLVSSNPGSDDALLMDAQGSDAAAIERRRFGTDSTPSAEWLGEELRLPENIVEAMVYHRFPQNARKDPQLANIVALARWIAQEKIRRSDPEPCPGEMVRPD